MNLKQVSIYKKKLQRFKNKGKYKFVPVDCRLTGKWRYCPAFLDLGARCKSVVSFTPRSGPPGKDCPEEAGWTAVSLDAVCALQRIETKPSSP
jgi:hypothetical protein